MPRQMYGRKRAAPAAGEALFEVEPPLAEADASHQPLAARMRPRDLDEFRGQDHLVGEGRVLRRAIESGKLPSMILWGPPGSGKTTLARIMARRAGARFVPIQAVSAGLADVRVIVDRALADGERGLAGAIAIDDDAKEFLVRAANGDARVALNALELAASASEHATLAQVQDALQRRALLYDRAGDQHYDTISAFIKSVRGSDPDAALYWLVRMDHPCRDPAVLC